MEKNGIGLQNGKNGNCLFENGIFKFLKRKILMSEYGNLQPQNKVVNAALDARHLRSLMSRG